MNNIITTREHDPLGAMLLDYLAGKRDCWVQVESPNFEMTVMSGATMFREGDELDNLERRALQECCGRILDVGGGSGCHSLELQKSGHQVETIDISPGCVEVMTSRGVGEVRHCNLFGEEGRRYDTILMLMNGLGICGTTDGLNLFLQFIPTLLADGGQVIADSTDLFVLDGQPEDNEGDGIYFGETQFTMRYNSIVSKPFNWLYIDFHSLEHLCRLHSIRCERLISEEDGRFLVRLF